MIVLKTNHELAAMQVAGRISINALKLAGQAVEPGVSIWEIDRTVRHYIENEDARLSPLGYDGFPISACTSVNNVVIHDIPSKDLILEYGDTTSVNISTFCEGFTGNNAYTLAHDNVSPEVQHLTDITRESPHEGIRITKAGNRVSDIDHAVQTYVEACGHSVAHDFVGHGIGAKLHEDPSIPDFGAPGQDVRSLPGMTIAIEPMVNAGVHTIKTLSDGWTTAIVNGKLAVHYEHSIVITADDPVILTLSDQEEPGWTLSEGLLPGH